MGVVLFTFPIKEGKLDAYKQWGIELTKRTEETERWKDKGKYSGQNSSFLPQTRITKTLISSLFFAAKFYVIIRYNHIYNVPPIFAVLQTLLYTNKGVLC